MGQFGLLFHNHVELVGPQTIILELTSRYFRFKTESNLCRQDGHSNHQEYIDREVDLLDLKLVPNDTPFQHLDIELNKFSRSHHLCIGCKK